MLYIILATLGVLAFSAIALYARKVTSYDGVRKIFVAICFIMAVRASLEALKFGNFEAVAQYYAIGSVVTDALILIFAAVAATGIYLNDDAADFHELMGIIRKNTKHTLVIGACLAYILFITALLITKPYHVGLVSTFWGSGIESVLYDRYYQFLRVPILAVLVGYVAPLIFVAARRTKDRELRTSLNIVWASWTGMGALLVFTTVSLNLDKIDITGLSFFIMAAVFSFGAIGFNNASLLVGFTEYKQEPILGSGAVHPFSHRLKKSPGQLSGKMFLLESKVGVEFGTLVRDFCIEQLSSGDKVFVVTNISSQLYKTLSKYHDIRFCLFSEKVRGPTLRESQNEIMIPQDGVSTILYVIEKFTTPKERVTLVFDNLSDIFITLGQDDGRKFLKSAGEFIAEVDATSLFVIYPETLDSMVLNWVRTMFGNILSLSEVGLKPLKEES